MIYAKALYSLAHRRKGGPIADCGDCARNLKLRRQNGHGFTLKSETKPGKIEHEVFSPVPDARPSVSRADRRLAAIIKFRGFLIKVKQY